MAQEDDNTLDALADEPQLSPAAADGAVSNEPKPENDMTLTELNTLLGKDFKDKATALKSVKDTYSYVGKRKEDIIKEVGGSNEDTAKEIKEIKENLFFKDNPQFQPYRNVMARMGSNPAEVAELPEFKDIFTKASGYDNDQKLKSVLQSNPRLAQTKDNLTKAREATNTEDRDRLVAQAVLATIEE